MSSIGDLVITSSSFLCVFLLFVLIKIIYKLWWIPTRIQKLMASQGITGPSYRFIHGNTNEISNMKKEIMNRPMKLSHDVLPVIQPHIHSWTKLYGKIFLQWYGAQPQLVVLEPNLCKEILINKDRAYSKQKAEGYLKKLIGDGLGNSNGEKWARSRKVADHAFHGENLKVMIPEIIASAEKMLQDWKSHEGKEIEVCQVFRLFTSEVISRTAFGSSYLEGQKLFDNIVKLSVFLVKDSFRIRFPGLSKFLKTSDEIEAEKIEKRIRDAVLEIINIRAKNTLMSTQEECFGNDFLGLLLRAHHTTNEKERISMDVIIDECKTVYVAGHETTTITLAWIVFLLAHYTDWQEKARNEVLHIFGKRTPDLDGLNKLKTMSMIINETQRLYPPLVSIERKANWDVKLGNLTVPANVEVHVPALALHHEPLFWGEDAQLFNPERFSEGVAKATNDNICAFLPFGKGPRICTGFNLATIQIKIALSMILQRYSFTLSPGYVHSPHLHFIMCPQHGVQVMLHPL